MRMLKVSLLFLFYLYKNAGTLIVPSDIARYIGASTARVANILNNLEEKGMISREISREDRRKILVFLTDKGRKETKERRTRTITRISNVFEAMGEREGLNTSLKLGRSLYKRACQS